MASAETEDRTVTGDLRIEHPADGVRVLVLDRPQRRNALTLEVLTQLARELERAAGDAAVRAVILIGTNGVFSAGADFDGIAGLSETPEAEVVETLATTMMVAETLWALPQPTIAVINGPAVGAGMSLALACDVRVGSPSMTLFPSFIRMGLLPDTGASWLLPRLIGEGPALQMLLAGRPVDADRALALGLVSELSDDSLATAIELAITFAARPPLAVAATKRLVRDAGAGDLARAIELEAIAQASAVHGAEFTSTFAAWRTSRKAD